MTKNNSKNFLAPVSDYYSARVLEHGQTAAGVDWNSPESQNLRFQQLCKVINNTTQEFSINDLGCGYGALLNYIDMNFCHANYRGTDVSKEMIQAGMSRFGDRKSTSFKLGHEPSKISDYGIASGIFNVKLKNNDADWLDYILEAISLLDRTSKIGFAFNCLTSYSDEEHMKANLYYADPCVLFDYCKKQFSTNVALLHDYNLYEFTILVRKPS